MPVSWGAGTTDVSGGTGATGGSFVTNRPETGGETILGGNAPGRGGRDATRICLPNFDSGRQMRMPDSRLDASTRGPITAEVKNPVPVSVSGDVTGEAQIVVKVEVSPTGELIKAAASAQNASVKLAGLIAANGPGSTGKSSPDAGEGSRD